MRKAALKKAISPNWRGGCSYLINYGLNGCLALNAGVLIIESEAGFFHGTIQTNDGLMTMADVKDEGPFYHGTIADLYVGDFLTAGYRSNYRPEVVMNHIYFTSDVPGAGLAAEIAAELAEGGVVPRVYVVEPIGKFGNDPNLTDKKFPGNPTRSYRSSAPLKVIGEIAHWTRLTPEALQMWREKLTALLSEKRNEIIN